MKKICFFILLLFTIIKVNALVEIDLENPIIRFPKIDDYVLQGFTNVDNKLFMVFIEPSKSKPLLVMLVMLMMLLIIVKRTKYMFYMVMV